jgi:ubiquinone/menaquinone biosynthesis C-methylase UbiE
MSDLEARVEREREAHDERDVLAENIRIKDKFSHIWSFPSRVRFYDRIESYVAEIEGMHILDFGCGRGDTALAYLRKGAHVSGIDISTVFIDDAKAKAAEAGFSDAQYDFRVMDAHDLDFPDKTFDIVIGFGILHHLDADIALREIYRVLKSGGRVLLQEPLADNPLLKLFRVLTPKARTEDEEPFSGKEVRRLTSLEEWQTELFFCGILEAPAAMLTSLLMPARPENWILKLTDRVERWLHKNEVLLSWNQYLCFNMLKREKPTTP